MTLSFSNMKDELSTIGAADSNRRIPRETEGGKAAKANTAPENELLFSASEALCRYIDDKRKKDNSNNSDAILNLNGQNTGAEDMLLLNNQNQAQPGAPAIPKKEQNKRAGLLPVFRRKNLQKRTLQLPKNKISNDFKQQCGSDIEIKGAAGAETLVQLEHQKAVKKEELEYAETALQDVFSNRNAAVKEASSISASAAKNHKEMLSAEKNMQDSFNSQINSAKREEASAQNAVKLGEKNVVTTKNALMQVHKQLQADDALINQLRAQLSALEQQRGRGGKDIEAQINRIKEQLQKAEAKRTLDTRMLFAAKYFANLAVWMLKAETKRLEKTKELELQLEKEFSQNSALMSEEVKKALAFLDEAGKNLEQIKDIEASEALEAISKARKDLNLIEHEIKKEKTEETKAENDLNEFNFGKNSSRSENFKMELEEFKKYFEKNKTQFKSQEKETGIKAGLIAALDWKEHGSDFTFYAGA